MQDTLLSKRRKEKHMCISSILNTVQSHLVSLFSSLLIQNLHERLLTAALTAFNGESLDTEQLTSPIS